MANTIKPRPLEPLMAEFQRMGFSEYAQRALRDMLTRMDKVLTDKGEVQSVANVTGRTEQLSSTLQNVTSAGKLNSLLNVVSDRNAANIAETSNLRYRTSAHSTSQVVGATITGLDSGGGKASITVTGSFNRVAGLSDYAFPDLLAVNLSNSTTYYIYLDDPNFTGVGTSMIVTTDQNALFSSASRFYVGTCTTPAGGAGNTSGKLGGNGGGVNRGTVLA